MKNITLRSKRLVVTEIVKPTKARLFKDFREGTVFKLSTVLVRTTGASNGLYALDITLTNYNTEESAKFTQNEVLRYLECFEYSVRGNK